MHAMNVHIACEQFICHQPVVCTQACSEDFCTRVVRALLHMHVFMKFKSSCAVSSDAESHEEQDGEKHFIIQPAMAELWLNLCEDAGKKEEEVFFCF